MMANPHTREKEYKVYLLPVVEKELSKLPEQIQKQLYDVIHALKYPYQILAIKMHNEMDVYRTKMGDYRIIYKIYNKEVIVVVIKIGHRKKVYK
ncbi:MAG: type II toxin-antitoxin system RelE/ParE family toxin [Candidatus Heimdallarchaeota archaeon]|nr:type II toxin-antitoxin system RelE/ParE family toxin [Candidatus Heimdallarchaeota archaeon]